MKEKKLELADLKEKNKNLAETLANREESLKKIQIVKNQLTFFQFLMLHRLEDLSEYS